MSLYLFFTAADLILSFWTEALYSMFSAINTEHSSHCIAAISLGFIIQYGMFLRAEKLTSVVVQLFSLFKTIAMSILSVVWLSLSKDTHISLVRQTKEMD